MSGGNRRATTSPPNTRQPTTRPTTRPTIRPTTARTTLPTRTPHPPAIESRAETDQITEYSRPRPYYVAGSQVVNARECPERDCAVGTTYQPGEMLTMTGEAEGETVGSSDIWYVTHEGYFVHSSTVSNTRPQSASQPSGSDSNPSSNIAVSTPVPFVCPSNCTEAVNMGLSAQQAASCGLDRDGDGVACYGD